MVNIEASVHTRLYEYNRGNEMGEPALIIGNSELERIGDYVKSHLRAWLAEMAPAASVSTQLLERMVRVEEELKSQRELMIIRFDAVDRRFEAVDRRFEAVDRRFEAEDKRFEDLISHVDKRFEAVDKRFGLIQWVMGIGFVMIGTLVTIFGVV